MRDYKLWKEQAEKLTKNFHYDENVYVQSNRLLEIIEDHEKLLIACREIEFASSTGIIDFVKIYKMFEVLRDIE